MSSSVARSPHKDGPFTFSSLFRIKHKAMSKKVFQIELSIELYLHDSVDEGTFGKRSRSIDRFAVVFRPPRGAVNVDMVWIKAECSRFNGVIDSAVQHPHAADAGVKSLCQHAMPISQNELNATATTSLEPGSRIGIFFLTFHAVTVTFHPYGLYPYRSYGYIPVLLPKAVFVTIRLSVWSRQQSSRCS